LNNLSPSRAAISRFIINSSPALMDWLLLLVNFAVMYRAGQQHFTFYQCAWLAGMWSLLYMLASMATGFLITRKNSRAILLGSTAGTVLATVYCLAVVKFQALMFGLALMGVFTAFFFNSFQAFMRGETRPGNLMKTVGIYTLSWSMGSGLGAISSGYLFSYGAPALAALSLAIGALIIATILLHRRNPLEKISSEEHIEAGGENVRPVDTRYVRVGWVIIFTAMFVQKPLVSFFPAIAASEGISSFISSLPLFLNFTIQALVGLAMLKWRGALYRRLPFTVIHLLAAGLYLAAWKMPTLSVCLPVFGLLGIYFGFAYFCSVYYSSNSGNRVFNVGINEFLVGTACLLGLFVCEWWMKYTADAASMYAVCAAMLVISAAVQFILVSPADGPRPLPGTDSPRGSAD